MNQVPLDQLPVDQLSKLRQQYLSSVNKLKGQINQLRSAADRFERTRESVSTLVAKQSEKKQEILAPFTPSLYIPATVVTVKKFKVDVGSGFYVEKSPGEVEKYIDSRLEEISRALVKLRGQLIQTDQVFKAVDQTLSAKLNTPRAQRKA